MFSIGVYACNPDGTVDVSSFRSVQSPKSCTLRLFLQHVTANMNFPGLPSDMASASAEEISNCLRVWKRKNWSSLFEPMNVLTEEILKSVIDSPIFNLSEEGNRLLLEHRDDHNIWARESEWACLACTFLNQGYRTNNCDICGTLRTENMDISNAEINRRVIKIPSVNTSREQVDITSQNEIPVAPTAQAPLAMRLPPRDGLTEIAEITKVKPTEVGKYALVTPPRPVKHAQRRSDEESKHPSTPNKGIDGHFPLKTTLVPSTAKQLDDNIVLADAAAVKLALLTGDGIDSCKTLVQSMINANGGELPSDSALRQTASNIQKELSSKLHDLIDDVCFTKSADAIGEIADKVMQRFLYVEKNVVYDDCFAAMLSITGATVYKSEQSRLRYFKTDLSPTSKISKLSPRTCNGDPLCSLGAKLFIKDCLLPITEHLLNQQNVKLGSDEAVQICNCLQCFVYILCCELEHGECRGLWTLAKILCPDKLLYSCIHVPPRRFDYSQAPLVGRRKMLSTRSEKCFGYGKAEDRHNINTCLKIACDRNMFDLMLRLLRTPHPNWIGLRSTAYMLETIFWSKEVVSDSYLCEVVNVTLQQLESCSAETFMEQTKQDDGNEWVSMVAINLVRLSNGDEVVMRHWLGKIVWKYFSSSNLQQRFFAVGHLVWWSEKMENEESTDGSYSAWYRNTTFIQFLRANKILEDLFSPERIRVELFERSKNLLLYMAKKSRDGDVCALTQDDIIYIWESCVGRGERLTSAIASLLVSLLQQMSVEMRVPIFEVWLNCVKRDSQSDIDGPSANHIALVAVMSAFSSPIDRLYILCDHSVSTLATRILWSLSFSKADQGKNMVSTLSHVLYSKDNAVRFDTEFVDADIGRKGNTSSLRSFCYKETIMNLINRINVEKSLYFFEEAIAGEKFMAEAAVERIREINAICLELEEQNPGTFGLVLSEIDGVKNQKYISLVGILLYTIKHYGATGREENGTVSVSVLVKQLVFLGTVACEDPTSKLSKGDVYVLWEALTSLAGRQAFFVWLGKAKGWPSDEKYATFESGVREFIFLELLCKRTDFRTLTKEGYQCFYKHFIHLNEKHIVMNFHKISEVLTRKLMGKDAIWTIIFEARESVSNFAVGLFRSLFKSLRVDKDLERAALMKTFLDYIREVNLKDTEHRAMRARLNRLFHLLRMLVADDNDNRVAGAVKSHGSSGRGRPLRFSIIAPPLPKDGGHVFNGMPLQQIQTKKTTELKAKLTPLSPASVFDKVDSVSKKQRRETDSGKNAVATPVDEREGNEKLEFMVETHTNACIWQFRRDVYKIMNRMSALNEGFPAVEGEEEYKKLKLTTRGTVLTGKNELLGSFAQLEDGNKIHAEFTIFPQEGILSSSLSKPSHKTSSIFNSRKHHVHGSHLSTEEIVSSSLAEMSTKNSIPADSVVGKNRFQNFVDVDHGTGGLSLSFLLEKNDDFYEAVFHIFELVHSHETDLKDLKWNNGFWVHLCSLPSWRFVIDEVSNPDIQWDAICSADSFSYFKQAYYVIAIHASLIPANDEDFTISRLWRQRFVRAGGFKFLLDFFMGHTGEEVDTIHREGLSTALQCVKFLVLGAIKVNEKSEKGVIPSLLSVTSTTRNVPGQAPYASRRDGSISSVSLLSPISPPRVGKLFEEDLIALLRAFDTDMASIIRETLREKILFSKLVTIVMCRHELQNQNTGLNLNSSDKDLVMLDSLHAMEEMLRGLPHHTLDFARLVIENQIVDIATDNSSILHRRAAATVLKSLWQCSVEMRSQEQEVFGMRLEAELCQAVQAKLSKMDGKTDGRYLELSTAIDFHIKHCVGLQGDDSKARWRTALETFLYTLPEERSSLVNFEESQDENARKENILRGILSNFVTLIKSVSPRGMGDQTGLTRFIVERGLFYIPSSKRDVGRALCTTAKTRRLAFQFLNACVDDSKLRSSILETIKIIYQSYQQFSLNATSRSKQIQVSWKYDPADAGLKHHGYCGLTNQGATCYINSLLQQFFMSKAIRDGVMGAQFDENTPKEAADILKELKRMFTFLKYSESKSYNTTAFVERCRSLQLTNDVLSQNDAAEFCDKLVDCLECCLKGTWEHFGGVVMHETDFIGVPYCSEREQPFVFLQLPIVSSGSNVAGDSTVDSGLFSDPVSQHKSNVTCASLEKSLDEFIKVEKMDGENQVECEEAGSQKFNALRRDWVSKLPRLLIVHLKRWELDFNTFAMKKVNDRCEFPMELNMAPYVKFADSCDNKENQQCAALYLLSGILIHRGPAGGGHYFSIIKDRKNGKWYRFNDENVVQFDPNKIDGAAFGKKSGDQSAYMLFYDRKDEHLGVANHFSASVTPPVNPSSSSISGSFDAVIDEDLSHFNAMFIQKQFLFDPELAKYLLDDIATFEYSFEEKKLGMYFFMDVLMRSYHTTLLVPFQNVLVDMLRKDLMFSLWTLRCLLGRDAIGVQSFQTQWLDALLDAPDVMKRSATERVINASLFSCVGDSGSTALLGNFFLKLLDLMWKAAKNWRNYAEYFHCLINCAKSEVCRQIMIEHDVIGRLIHFFLGNTSINPNYPSLLPWASAASSWGYATTPPDRMLPLKTMVEIVEAQDLYQKPRIPPTIVDMSTRDGMGSISLFGDSFYVYCLDIFEIDSPQYRLVERIAAADNVNLLQVKEREILHKLSSNADDGSIIFGSREMYAGTMYAVATIFIIDMEVPFDGIITSAKICITSNRERPMSASANDWEICVYEKCEKNNIIVFDGGVEVEVKYADAENKDTIRAFQPGHRVTAMKIDRVTGDMGDFETGVIKSVHGDSGTYDVYFDDGTTCPNLIGDFIAASDEPLNQDRQSFKIVNREKVNFNIKSGEVQEVADLHMEVKKGQFLGIVNFKDKLWLSWEQHWKNSDPLKFKNWYTTRPQHSREIGSTVTNLRISTSRPQYSFQIRQENTEYLQVLGDNILVHHNDTSDSEDLPFGASGEL